MKLKTLAMIAATGGLMVAAGPSFGVACSTLPTVGDWITAGSCTDVDNDTTWTYISSIGVDGTTGFTVQELDVAGVDLYNLSLNFAQSTSGSLTGTAQLRFTATNTNTERFISANFDTALTEATGTSGAVANANFNTPAGFTLTSTDGSRDPTSGETALPGGPVQTVDVTDFWNPGAATPAGTAVLNNSTNSFQVTVPLPTPEPATLLLLGAGLAGMGLVRRRKSS